MKRVFIYIFILLLGTSCATCRNCRNAVLNSVDCRDSVVIRETIVYRDTLIHVPVKAKLPEKARTETKPLIRTEGKTVEIDRLTKWQNVMISLGYIFIGICGALIAYQLWKLLRK